MPSIPKRKPKFATNSYLLTQQQRQTRGRQREKVGRQFANGKERGQSLVVHTGRILVTGDEQAIVEANKDGNEGVPPDFRHERLEDDGIQHVQEISNETVRRAMIDPVVVC